jgi:virginiamycin B lyase
MTRLQLNFAPGRNHLTTQRRHVLKFIVAAAFAPVAGFALAQAPTVRDPRLSLDALPVTARIELPSSADWMAFGFGSVWIVNYRPSRVSRVDAAANRLTKDIPLGRNGCLGVVVALERVWVPTCGDGVVNEIDPATDSIVRRIPAPIKVGREGAVAFANGALWIPDNVSDSTSASIARLDLQSGVVQAHVPTGKRSDVVVAGFGSVWVSSSAEDVVTRIDPATNQVLARIVVGRSPKFMAAGEGAVWVQNRYDGSVSRIDPATNREVSRISAWAPTLAGDIATGGGAVWLSVNGMPVTRIDPNTNAVTHQYVGGDGIDAIRWGAGALWVADHALGQLWRIDDRRIVPR